MKKLQRRRPGGTVIIGTFAVWATARFAVTCFHHTRRFYLRNLLFEVSNALNELEVKYWLDFGSLLGIFRDGDIIPHDNDIDFAVLNPDWETILPELKKRLEPKYSVKVVIPKDNPDSKWLRVYCPLGMADLFGAYHDDSDGKFQDIVKVDCGHGDHMHILKDLVLPTGTMGWKHHELSVPANIEGTLEHRYGKNWRVPSYMDKGSDEIEHNKTYAKIFRLLARIGIRI